MGERELEERLAGDGTVMLPDGKEVPTTYDVRVYKHFRTVVSNAGTRRLESGFTSYECSLDHRGMLRPDLAKPASMHLVMDDGRRLELLWTRFDIENGVTDVTVTGGILPALN